MSLMETSQSKGDKQTNRLYPSLPNTDRYEFCLPGRSSGEKLHTAAESLLDDTRSEGLSPSSEVTMKAHIFILEEQRRELLSINEKWVKEYRTMVQYYKEKVNVLKASQQHDRSEEEAREGGKHVTLHKNPTFKTRDEEETRSGGDDVSSELLRAEKEAKELRVQNSALTRRGQHQHREIRRLNKALEEALQTSQHLDMSSDTLHDMWKHQAEVYKEDFLKERRDREKLKEKYLELEKKFRKVHNELRGLKSQATWTRQPQLVLHCSCTGRGLLTVKQHHSELQRRCALDNKQ